MNYYRQYPAADIPPTYYYPQPPPPQQQQQPSPYMFYDAEHFRAEFSDRLMQLTVNSRPIIQGLAVLAQENIRFADVVGQCLEAHIRRMPPFAKLPSFYLLDMISKNVHDPYPRVFSRFIVKSFLEAYRVMDELTRQKMNELVITWRTSAIDHRELFGVPVQMAIEDALWGDGASGSVVRRNRRQLTARSLIRRDNHKKSDGLISQGQVMSELEYILGQKERAVQINQYDAISKTHITVLRQLRDLVRNGVSQDELKQILSQLRSLQPAPTPQSIQPVASTSSAPPQWTPTVPPPTIPSIPPPRPVAIAPVSTTPLMPDFAALLSNLQKAGVVSSANSTPRGAGESVKGVVPDNEPNPTQAAVFGYRNAILGQQIQLTTADLTRKRCSIPDFLYTHQALQCKQCALRFPDTVLGKKNMEAHLDIHFKQNQKSNQNNGRGHSRSWFVGVDDWVHTPVGNKGKGHATNSKVQAMEDAATREANLRAQFVVVPQGDEAKQIACPICKESLKSEWLEDDEEWVWKNAIMKDEKVYHATCHAEASTNVLAARLRSDIAQQANSRSSTPDRTGTTIRLSQSPNGKGVKRKIEDDNLLTNWTDGNPPAKRIALTTA